MSQKEDPILTGDRADITTDSIQSSGGTSNAKGQSQSLADNTEGLAVPLEEISWIPDAQSNIGVETPNSKPFLDSNASSSSSATLYRTPEASLSSVTIQSSTNSSGLSHNSTRGHGVCCNFKPLTQYLSVDSQEYVAPTTSSISTARVNWVDQTRFYNNSRWPFTRKRQMQRPRTYIPDMSRKERKRRAAEARLALQK